MLFFVQALGDRGLSKTGTKPQLVDRLVEAISAAVSSKPAPGDAGQHAKRPAANPPDPNSDVSSDDQSDDDQSEPGLIGIDHTSTDDEQSSPTRISDVNKRRRLPEGSPGLSATTSEES